MGQQQLLYRPKQIRFEEQRTDRLKAFLRAQAEFRTLRIEPLGSVEEQKRVLKLREAVKGLSLKGKFRFYNFTDA